MNDEMFERVRQCMIRGDPEGEARTIISEWNAGLCNNAMNSGVSIGFEKGFSSAIRESVWFMRNRATRLFLDSEDGPALTVRDLANDLERRQAELRNRILEI